MQPKRQKKALKKPLPRNTSSHLVAVNGEDLKHRVVPHDPLSAAAVEYLMLGWEKVVCRILAADLKHKRRWVAREARSAPRAGWDVALCVNTHETKVLPVLRGKELKCGAQVKVPQQTY